MTEITGPQRDEPRDPRPASPRWVEPAKPGDIYPPGFEPDAPEASPADPTGEAPRPGDVDPPVAAGSSAGGTPGRKGASVRRPVVAGVVGGVLIALLGFGGGYAVGNLPGGDDDDQLVTQGISRLAPPDGHDDEPEGDGDRGPGLRQAPGGELPPVGDRDADADT